MEEESKFCKNCKRDVSAANFSLHEAHCMRFLAICPECDEPIALKEMEKHQEEEHKQVRCKLCHQSMQKYLLENHESYECNERSLKCTFCELEMPFNKLQRHQEACGSRTELCWECNKYIMYKDLDKHKDVCQNGKKPSSNGLSDNLCQQCNKCFPDDQYLQHLNECSPLSKLAEILARQSVTKSRPLPPSSLVTSPPRENAAMAWKDVRPKRKEKDLSSASRPSLKPLKNKKSAGRPAFTATVDPVLPKALEDPMTYDVLVTCSQCNILLPGPTLRKHERKCLRLASLQSLRRKPKWSPGKQEEPF
ncbi:XIAP-associated factor 1 isoform X3 [Mauremys reevesii]|uniref:XIAP-associated factor 1 isoform X3 n=1 Tax=Mauremys reevesii TaxID=260615 RepID=UPI0019400C88|nr:XIAP-associated factor 1 isoform X3 [Mauremys reevesii]